VAQGLDEPSFDEPLALLKQILASLTDQPLADQQLADQQLKQQSYINVVKAMMAPMEYGQDILHLGIKPDLLSTDVLEPSELHAIITRQVSPMIWTFPHNLFIACNSSFQALNLEFKGVDAVRSVPSEGWRLDSIQRPGA